MKDKEQQAGDKGNAVGSRPAAKATAPAKAEAAKPKADPIADLVPNVDYTDLREWIANAQKLGEVREVSGASWQQDIGLATEMLSHEDRKSVV